MQKLKSNKMLWVCCDPIPPVPLNTSKSQDIILGRQEDCHIVLPHNCVSRKHARIRSIFRGPLIVEDLGSSNGTFLNGTKVTLAALRLGDSISIGPFDIEIRENPSKNRENNFNQTNIDFLTTSRRAAMAGQIEKTSLVEVLQNIEFHSKTGTLFIETKYEDGFFVFASGKPVSAEFGGAKNKEALMKMLALTKGCFILSDKPEPIRGEITESISSILFNFSRIQDEVKDGNKCRR